MAGSRPAAPRATQDAVAARRWSAIVVGITGWRYDWKSVPAATSAEARVQSVPSDIRFDTEAPAPIGRAAQVRPHVSTIHPPVASATRNDES